ncbi:hypothetical protein [Bacillus velezensis]|uniref:hypothetical protein n=1 Tax=Bacillus velezensis TaxID=492670 RepID=UPI001F2FBFBE|nr:hypothetical protein [Bacillus velezensis]MCE4941041.1 hypothetical protein [Bacillus velezensis]
MEFKDLIKRIESGKEAFFKNITRKDTRSPDAEYVKAGKNIDKSRLINEGGDANHGH